MHGTLEKKVPRPFGLAAWQQRDVSLEEDALVVRNAKRPADTKRYPFAFVSLQPTAKAPKNKRVFPSDASSRHSMHSSPTVHWQPWLVLASWESSVRIMMW